MPLDRCYSASNSAISVGLLTEGSPMHALLIRHNYVAKHVTPSTHPPHPILPRYFSKGAGSWVISHDWFLLSFLGNCYVKDDRWYKPHQSASASHSVFNVWQHGRATRSNERLQIMLGGAVRGAQLSTSYFFDFCFRPDLLLLQYDCSIDLWSTIVHLLSARSERRSTRQRAPQWNNDAERERGQIGFFNLTAGILLMHQRDCILSARKLKLGIFKTLTKVIVCRSFVPGGCNTWTTFCDTFVCRTI